MPLSLANQQFNNALIVDDDPAAREATGEVTRDLGLQSRPARGPLKSIDTLLTEVKGQQFITIADHHLRVKSYATFDGAELVATMYENKVPALLCTRFERAEVMEIRNYRARIPVLLTPGRLDVDSVRRGIEICIKEFEGIYSERRRTWRTLVRVENVEPSFKFADVVVSAWNPNTVIRIGLTSFPKRMRNRFKSELRLHAMVNIGAESEDELYFVGWEHD